ncbi:MAG: MFS transporter [Brucella intermedia]
MHYANTEDVALFRKVRLRILTLVFVCYVLAYLDRVNIAFAKTSMQNELDFSDAAYGLGAGLFFIGYMIFEIPSTLLLLRIGVRRTVSRIMICWGVTSIAMMFVNDPIEFYILRFLLGAFEAGFTPAMLTYLGVWLPAGYMARALSIITTAPLVAGGIAGPLSLALISVFDELCGLSGWQWMFLIEGSLTVFVGIAALWWFDDHPEHAKWLSASERAIVLAKTKPSREPSSSLWQVVRYPTVHILAASYLCIICGVYAITLWLPTIVESAGANTPSSIGVYSSIPYLVAIPVVYAISVNSDRRRERRLHAGISVFMGATALLGCLIYLDNLVVSLICVTVAVALISSGYTVFWAMPSEYIEKKGVTGAIALINLIGLFGGFLSPNLIGFMRSGFNDIKFSLIPIVILLYIGGVVLLVSRRLAANRRTGWPVE